MPDWGLPSLWILVDPRDMPSHISPSQTKPRETEQTRGVATLRRSIWDVAPGLLLCVGGAALAMVVAQLAPALSPLLVAIVLGAVLTNVTRLPSRTGSGVTFSAKALLRVGIALLGLQLLLRDILDLGWQVIVVVVVVVLLGIAGTVVVGAWLGLSWTQRLLIACGFSVCGAAAVAAIDGVVDAEEEEVLTSVALVVLFGTLMIPAVPLLSSAIGLSNVGAGMWAGASIHEVAQVVAAGGAIGGAALSVAVVVKLTRVLMLAPIATALSVYQRRIAGTNSAAQRPPLVPLFIVAFLALVSLRSTGVVPQGALDVAEVLQTGLLTTAMFALGTGVQISTLKSVGVRPFVLAALSTVWVAGIALVGVLLTQGTIA